MPEEGAFTWDQQRPAPPHRPTHRAPRPQEAAAPDPADDADRITLREAEHRFGTKVGTLRSWARRGTINAVMVDGAYGRQWMVTPESVAHHLSRTGSEPRSPATGGATGPTSDGSAMLVPRDAWDRLMDQLGNLHESGMMLAEARERAAKAETEATFLRERLSEMRSERDEARVMAEEVAARARRSTAPPPPRPQGSWLRRLFGGS